MLTNITKLENGTYVLKRDVENSNADGGGDDDNDSDVEVEASMMACGVSSGACPVTSD